MVDAVLVDSSRQQVTRTDGEERRNLTSEVSHHLQVPLSLRHEVYYHMHDSSIG